MSHAPGRSGTPPAGQSSSAATSASCARSSATPTSWVRRASPATRRGNSIRHTASIARRTSGAVTPGDGATSAARCARPDRSPLRGLAELRRLLAHALLLRPHLGREGGAEVLGLEHLPDL